ncbi:hypothetical protein ACFL27_24980 [candidate division CSSED10-310 bacterium]|uniref:Glycosyltransferase RgtA/B/C/D-like domain-containing protein n=1 Tax=candidate division CSSED10-310 bacterium TaxID=2855610 RepID=A0ABV6Z4T4_UNCC1
MSTIVGVILNRKTDIVWVVLLVAVIIVSFSGILSQPEFLSDDWSYLHMSQHWTDILSPDSGLHYIPVFCLYLKMMFWLFGLKAIAFSIGNLVLHSLNALLLCGLARRLSGTSALGYSVGLVYATHFLINEGVFWVTGSATMLMVCFYLLTLRSYLWALDFEDKSIRLLAPYCLGLLCIYTLESGVTVLVVCALADLFLQWEKNGRTMNRAFFKRLLFIAIRLVPISLIVVSIVLIKQIAGVRLAVAFELDLMRTYAMIVQYFLHLWLPFEEALLLLFDHQGSSLFWVQILSKQSVVLHVSCLISVILPSVLILWKGSKVQVLALLWFWCTILALSLATLAMTSRYQVLVGVPASLLLVSTLWRFLEAVLRYCRLQRPIWLKVAAACVIVPLVVYGMVKNVHKGNEYRLASELTARILESPLLLQTLQNLGDRSLIVLNLPDHIPVKNDLLGKAFVFRNGFRPALLLKGLIDQPGKITVAREQGVGLRRNVWNRYRELSNTEIQMLLREGSTVLLFYDHARQNFRPRPI